MRNLSVSVIYKDNGYDGKVCHRPCYNACCESYPKVRRNVDKVKEAHFADGDIALTIETGINACIPHNAAFLCDHEITYPEIPSPAHLLTPDSLSEQINRIPPYSLCVSPTAWLLRENDALPRSYGANLILENTDDENSNRRYWIDALNIKAIYDAFFNDIRPGSSYVLVYLEKQPYSDDGRPLLLGLGRILGLHRNAPYRYNSQGQIHETYTHLNWMQHSIRRDNRDGFLLPYEEIRNEHPDFDLSRILVYAPEGYGDAFCGNSNIISHDALLEAIDGFRRSWTLIKANHLTGQSDEDIDAILAWLDTAYRILLDDRPDYPGFGNLLSVLSSDKAISNGIALSKEIEALADRSEKNLQVYFETEYLNGPDCPSSLARLWSNYSHQDQVVFFHLARYDLTVDQYRYLFATEPRLQTLRENPYRMFERTRLAGRKERIPFSHIDRPLFYRTHNTQINDDWIQPNDARRLRAFLVDYLETLAKEGSTLLPLSYLDDRKLEAYGLKRDDIPTRLDAFYETELSLYSIPSGISYLKLKRYQEIDDAIKTAIDSRREAIDLPGEDYAMTVNALIPGLPEDADMDNRIQDALARSEKANALEQLMKNSFSIITGMAGTGKTKLLSVFAAMHSVHQEGLVVLCPNGRSKAKLFDTFSHYTDDIDVISARMERLGIYNSRTRRYEKSSLIDETAIGKNILVDDASLLDEDMLAAVFTAYPNAKRIILAGDPNILPPSGVGKPFQDILRYLTDSPEVITLSTNCRLLTLFPDTLSFDFAYLYSQGVKEDGSDLLETILTNPIRKKTIDIVSYDGLDDLMEKLMDRLKHNASPFLDETNGKPKLYQRFELLTDTRSLAKSLSSGMLSILKHDKGLIADYAVGEKVVVEEDVTIASLTNTTPSDAALYENDLGVLVEGYNRTVDLLLPPQIQPIRNPKLTQTVTLSPAYALSLDQAKNSTYHHTYIILERDRPISKEAMYTALTRHNRQVSIYFDGDVKDLLSMSADDNSLLAKRLTDLCR